MLSKIYNSLSTLAYPQACHICSGSVENLADGTVCSSCWKKTVIFRGRETLCRKCGVFQRTKSFSAQTFCHRCDEHLYDRAAAVGLYEHALAAAVLRLKREPFIAKRLQKLIIEAYERADFQNPTLIMPVPLSKKRRIERGFNQAEILARHISTHTGLKTDGHSLVRRTDTTIHRAGLDRRGRELSVKNAFVVNGGGNRIAGGRILLTDDVLTSGATVSNCAKVLKKAGADRVYVLTIARAS